MYDLTFVLACFLILYCTDPNKPFNIEYNGLNSLGAVGMQTRGDARARRDAVFTVNSFIMG